MTLALTSINGDLWLPTVDAVGVVSDPNARVWVNGVEATNNRDGTWNAYQVPISASGMASFDLSTIPPGGSDPIANTNVNKSDEKVMDSAKWNSNVEMSGGANTTFSYFYHGQWNRQTGGRLTYHWEQQMSNSVTSFEDETDIIGPDCSIIEEYGQYTYGWWHEWLIYDSYGKRIGMHETDVYDGGSDDGDVIGYDLGGITIEQKEGSMNPSSDGFYLQNEADSDVDMEFDLGGNPSAGAQVLIEGTATASELYPISTNVAFDEITDGQVGQLDDSGLADTVVADGSPVNVKPQARVPYYAMTTSPGVNRPVSETEMPAPNDPTFTHPDRTKLGVGEKVVLRFNPDLTKNAKWQTSDGGLSHTNYTSNEFTAPSNANPSVVVKAIINRKTVPFSPFNVVEPSGYKGLITATNHYPPGLLGAGMTNLVYWLPTDVSFYRLRSIELRSYAVNIFGYYTNVSFQPVQVGSANVGNDNAFPDYVGSGTITPSLPIYLGGFDVYITNYWQVQGSTISNFFAIIPMTARIINSSGDVSINKYGITLTRGTNDVSH